MMCMRCDPCQESLHFLYLPFFNPVHFHVFCAHPFFCIHFSAFFCAHMLTVCSDETSSLLFLRFSETYDDNLEDNSVFQSLLKFPMLWGCRGKWYIEVGHWWFSVRFAKHDPYILSRVTTCHYYCVWFYAANENCINSREIFPIMLVKEHVQSWKSSRLFYWLLLGIFSSSNNYIKDLFYICIHRFWVGIRRLCCTWL